MAVYLKAEQRKEIIDKFATGEYSRVSLSKEYGVGRKTIARALKKAGFRPKTKYQCDEKYFEKIDTEGKAYFFGWMCADGCNDYKRGRFVLRIQERDVEILEMFKNELQSNHKLFFYKAQKENWQNQYSLGIRSIKLSEQLFKLGCVPGKTFTLEFPDSNIIPECLMNHFMRGFFDGDGTFYFAKRKDASYYYKRVSMISSSAFCEGLQKYLFEKFGFNYNKLHDRSTKQDGSIKQIMIDGTKAIAFLDWVYRDAHFLLKRKYQKFLKAYTMEGSFKPSPNSIFHQAYLMANQISYVPSLQDISSSTVYNTRDSYSKRQK